ncbi:hypothetical protein FRX31_019352 [Thalictrum thalictroides]|uniref:Uncharacterized protein n=1 Tax=Thalictrum thalictroides TaxID=46969 RepID=A0A7J6W3H1_THATH|nr:hypothetical protein FRX31_019352 [Thalictrum thalictroides]
MKIIPQRTQDIPSIAELSNTTILLPLPFEAVKPKVKGFLFICLYQSSKYDKMATTTMISELILSLKSVILRLKSGC